MANKPITAADFQALWVSSTDDSYSRPFVENPNDTAFEVWGQEFKQFERVSEAIDVTTQALFILGWSGQSNLPARGAQQATVTLTLQRSKLLTMPLVVDTDVWVQESTGDWGPNGPVPVLTGRRYSLVAPLVFNPGETGPFTVQAIAERPGYGYNNPQPGTLSVLQQLGSNLSNGNATYDNAADKMVSAPYPDTPVPEHVGQYLRFIAGANPGALKRAVVYGAANPPTDGGTLFFEKMAAFEGQYLVPFNAGVFTPGEGVQLLDVSGSPPYPVLATGVLVKQSGSDDGSGHGIVLSMVLQAGVVPAPMGAHVLMFGTLSKVGVQLTTTTLDPLLANGANETWEMASWNLVFGLTVSNAACPQGGRAAMLDALGNERKLPRSTGEDDDTYAKRVHQVADTVSPNAVRRAGNRVLAPYGLNVCLREVGSELLPGFFFDANDAYDYDTTVRPQLRNNVWLDYPSFRGYFRIGLPALGWGEFGFAYDVGPWNAYDNQGPTYLDFYDGYPWQTARLYLNVYQAIATVVAGGVGFDFYIEQYGCT